MFLRLLFLRWFLPDVALPVLVEFVSLYYRRPSARSLPFIRFPLVIRNIRRLPGILVTDQRNSFHLSFGGFLLILCLIVECSCFHAVCHYWKNVEVEVAFDVLNLTGADI